MTVRSRLFARPLLALASLSLAMCAAHAGSQAVADGGADSSSAVAQPGTDGGATGATGGTGGGDASNRSYADASGSATNGDAGAGGTGATGSATVPADCPASDVGNSPLGTDTPDPTGTAVTALTYTGVGADGGYDQVEMSTMAPSCTPNVCDKVPKDVSGPLVPFNEEMTLVFSGPMELYQIATYTPSNGTYDRTSYWDRCTTSGLAFVGNKHWYTCNGFVQSYVTDDGTAEADASVQFAGSLGAGIGVNVMSDVLCSGDTYGSDCGFSLGLALHGFAGDADGSKIFAAKFRMPLGTVTPAFWILPAQVVRSSQYGCNCRGEGAAGGCGELDVAEVLGGATATPAHPQQATTTIYSFQGVNGGGTAYFQRPVYETATFIVIFDAPSQSIAIRRLDATAFDFRSSLTTADVGSWLADAGEVRAMP